VYRPIVKTYRFNNAIINFKLRQMSVRVCVPNDNLEIIEESLRSYVCVRKCNRMAIRIRVQIRKHYLRIRGHITVYFGKRAHTVNGNSRNRKTPSDGRGPWRVVSRLRLNFSTYVKAIYGTHYIYIPVHLLTLERLENKSSPIIFAAFPFGRNGRFFSVRVTPAAFRPLE